jgi:hypothetical protein
MTNKEITHHLMVHAWQHESELSFDLQFFLLSC